MVATTKSDPGSPQGSIEADRRCLLTGLRVLVVEDVGMVAMAVKAMLDIIGCVVVGMPARLAEAENMARQGTFDGVLLDLNLGGRYAFSVADILRERDIPFIIISGYDAGILRPDLAGAPLLQKPFVTAALEAMLLTVFCPGSNSNAIA